MPLAVPASPDWLHEIKYDGYRLRLEGDGDRVRLITRGGHNWPDRYPWIVEAAGKNRVMRFIMGRRGRRGSISMVSPISPAATHRPLGTGSHLYC